jgi:hypothetical protein
LCWSDHSKKKGNSNEFNHFDLKKFKIYLLPKNIRLIVILP